MHQINFLDPDGPPSRLIATCRHEIVDLDPEQARIITRFPVNSTLKLKQSTNFICLASYMNTVRRRLILLYQSRLTRADNCDMLTKSEPY